MPTGCMIELIVRTWAMFGIHALLFGTTPNKPFLAVIQLDNLWGHLYRVG